MDWLDLLAVQGTLKSLLQHHSSKASILRCSAFFIVQLSHPYMTTGKTIALTRWTFVGKVMSLLLNMLSRLVITFLPRSKRLLISWLQSSSAVILEPPKISLTLFPLFPHLFPMKWWDQTNHNSSYLFKFCMPHKQPNFLVSCSIFVLNSHQIFNYGHVKSFLLHLCFPESACYSAVSSRKRNCLRPSGKGLCQMFWGTSFWCHYLNNFEILSLQWARVSRTLGNELIDSWGC